MLLRKTGFEPIEIDGRGQIRALARKATVSTIDFNTEGDDYKRIISNLRRRYIRIITVRVRNLVASPVSLSIRLVLGEQRGRKILNLIKKLVPIFRG